MICSYPLVLGKNRIHGCGQCLSCRVNQSRKWSTRISLEAAISDNVVFVTLTYNDENNPGRLDKSAVQKFLKRLRKRHSFRYYACGEYGENYGRPHYHVLLFYRDTDGDCPSNADIALAVSKSWSLGFVTVEPAKSSAAHRYVSKYVTKKATKEWDKDDPEWHLSSMHPGLGAEAVSGLCESLLFYNYFDGNFDVPSFIELGGKKLPLDSYIRTKMRTYILDTYGIVCDPSEGVRDFAMKFEELWEDYKMALRAKEKLGADRPLFGIYANFGRHISDAHIGKRVAFEKRLSMKRKSGL